MPQASLVALPTACLGTSGAAQRCCRLAFYSARCRCTAGCDGGVIGNPRTRRERSGTVLQGSDSGPVAVMPVAGGVPAATRRPEARCNAEGARATDRRRTQVTAPLDGGRSRLNFAGRQARQSCEKAGSSAPHRLSPAALLEAAEHGGEQLVEEYSPVPLK